MKKHLYTFAISICLIFSLAAFASTASATAPANDNFASAQSIALGVNGTLLLTSNNLSATKEGNEPNHADNAGGKSVWFSFTPTVTRAVELRTISGETDFDTLLAVYTGNDIDALTHVGSNDDCYRLECGVRSRVRLLLQAGTTYRIAIDGYNNGTSAASGTFKLIMEEYTSSAFDYDNMENAYDLGLINKVSIGATNHLATGQVGEPAHSAGGIAAGKSVWFRFTVPSTRAMTVSVKEDFRNEMAVYESMIADPTFADLEKLDDGNDHTGFDATETSANFLAWQNRYYFVAVDWNNSAVSGAQTGNFQLRIFQTKLRYGMRFDKEDEFASVGVYRPADSTWYCLYADDSAFPLYKKFGLSSDTPVPADYDGDALTNFAVTRNLNGKKHWYILRPEGSWGYQYIQWGLSTDKEVVGDFDRDGRADPTAIRDQGGTLVWYVRQSQTESARNFVFGQTGDRPVVGDFDGDGATEVAVVRETAGNLVWYILRSNGNQYTTMAVQNFGIAGDLPAAEDYDGDGKSDVALYRPSEGTWYIIRSGSGQLQVTPYGTGIDVPQPGDYDGDGKAELALFRPTTGKWYFWYSGSNSQGTLGWGIPGDKPVASAARFSLPESNE